MGSVREISAAEPNGSRAALIRAELEKILASPAFAKSGRLSEFLRFVVENELRNKAEPLKETLIGVQVYGRPADYDPKAEPIVRTEARRLRLKLQEYYTGPGSDDRVTIIVPSGGYVPQFEIRPEATPKIVSLPPQPELPAQPRFASGKSAKWLLAILAGICVVLAWEWLQRTRRPTVTSEIPVTRLPGFEFQPSVSPDGKLVAFVWNGSDQNYDIYVKALDSGNMRRLTRSAAYDLFPSWSPDGQTIAFLRMFPAGRKQVFLIPAAGGEERLVATPHSVQPQWVHDPSTLDFSPGPVWSADGKFIAVSDRSNRQEPDALYLVSVASGQSRRLTAPDTHEVGDYFPAFSTDSRMLAFVRVSNQRRSSDIYIQKLAGGQVKRITSDSKNYFRLELGVNQPACLFFRSKWKYPALDGLEPRKYAGTGAWNRAERVRAVCIDRWAIAGLCRNLPEHGCLAHSSETRAWRANIAGKAACVLDRE